MCVQVSDVFASKSSVAVQRHRVQVEASFPYNSLPFFNGNSSITSSSGSPKKEHVEG